MDDRSIQNKRFTSECLRFLFGYLNIKNTLENLFRKFSSI